MKKILGWMIAGLLTLGIGALWADEAASTGNAGAVATPAPKAKTKTEKQKASKAVYVCPMCQITSDKPGNCPMCGMKMVKQKKAPAKPENKPADGKSKQMSGSAGSSQGFDLALYGKGADAKMCPVSGDKIKAGKGVELVLAGGKKIMVCCPDCQKDIDKDPAKYASLMY